MENVLVIRPKGPEKWELFYIEKDPGEVHAVAEENPEKLAKLPSHWERYVVETGTIGRTCDWGLWLFRLMSLMMMGNGFGIWRSRRGCMSFEWYT